MFIAEEVVIMFCVDRDSGARMSRSAINHSVEAGLGGAGSVKEGVAMGAVTVWQGDVS